MAALSFPTFAQTQRLRWADMHSHHGMVPAKRNAQTTKLANDMRDYGLAVAAICLVEAGRGIWTLFVLAR